MARSQRTSVNSEVNMIHIDNLHASIEGKPILKGLSLNVQPGQIHAIMGPNGAGKSTLAKVLAGDSFYEVTEGHVWYKKQNILDLEPEERMHLGIFMTFQYPIEIPGVSNFQFLHTAYNAQQKSKGKKPLTEEEFDTFLDEKMRLMDMRPEFKSRSVNEGFSGGEKKRNEILQMAVFSPEVAILDETDSGLDIDAMKVVAKGVNSIKTPETSLIVITHYQRLLDYIKPDFVHVMINGKIVQSGDSSLALKLESQGYDWLENAIA